jgi:hypothetical protein
MARRGGGAAQGQVVGRLASQAAAGGNMVEVAASGASGCGLTPVGTRLGDKHAVTA